MVIFSGIQPSGNLHIGNYAGAIKQFTELQDKNEECFFCIVDLHALTSTRNQETLSQFKKELKRAFYSFGLTKNNTTLFVQSEVPEHTQLAWILSTTTPLGDLERMTQFKDKQQQGIETNVGLFTYPILMASDILLYDTDKVPVGEDQIQHLELTRTIARKFNHYYGSTFKEPKAILSKSSAKIMSLKDPTKKMSKSLGEQHYIRIFENEESIKNKIKNATTDSDSSIKYDTQTKPGISNLINLYSIFTDKTIEETEQNFHNSSYVALKEEVAKALLDDLTPMREKFISLSDKEVDEQFENGKTKARDKAQHKINKVYKNIGLTA